MGSPRQAVQYGPGRPLALVMGGSRGLGLLVADELAARGHDLVLCSRTLESLQAAREQLLVAHPDAQVHVQVCDAADESAVARMVEEVEREIGPVEAAIHVAGIIAVGPWEATGAEHLRTATEVMLWGPVNLALALIPAMKQRGRGRFGVVSSIGGVIAPPRLLAYSTAKFAAAGFTQALSAELAGSGVTATTIVPGLMRTGSHGQAQFYGDAAHQYAWFAPVASLPLVSMDARRAAAAMVDAVLAGRPVALISPLSKVAARVHGIAPSTTVRLMGLASRLLPRGTQREPVSGEVARRLLDSRLVDAMTTLGDRAARRTNEPR